MVTESLPPIDWLPPPFVINAMSRSPSTILIKWEHPKTEKKIIGFFIEYGVSGGNVSWHMEVNGLVTFNVWVLRNFLKLRTVQCLLYCARNKQPACGQGRSTYIFEAVVSQAHFAICLRENFSQSENILWYRSMFPLRSTGVGNILNYVAIT